MFQPADLGGLLRALPAAEHDSWLEVRSFRGGVRRFTPETAPSYAEAMAFPQE